MSKATDGADGARFIAVRETRFVPGRSSAQSTRTRASGGRFVFVFVSFRFRAGYPPAQADLTLEGRPTVVIDDGRRDDDDADDVGTDVG